MYIPANAIPAWLGALGWAAAVVSVGAAVWRFRRDPPAPAGVVAAGAFVAAIRLLEFPVGEDAAGGASVLAVGFAVVVFGPDVAVLAMAAATLAAGVVAAPFDGVAVGANFLVYAAVLPWILGWGYEVLKKAATSAAAGYVLAFVAGAFGAPLAALAVGVVAGAGGAVDGAAAEGLLRAGLALAAAEGVLATWGYTLAGGTTSGEEGPGAGVPRSGAVALGVLAVVVAAGVAPLVPTYGGPLGPMPALARAADLSYGGKVAAGLAVCGLAALAMLLPWSVARLSRRRVPK
jgi:ABC-type Co2+ transport system permease subunit